MSITVYLSPLLVLGFLYGIRLMQSPRTAVRGNRLGACCMALATFFVMSDAGLFGVPLAWFSIALGGGLGLVWAQRIGSIHMPQTVALLNGFGGAASALAVAAAMSYNLSEPFRIVWFTVALALGVGGLTFSGSIVAALKLQGRIRSLPAVPPALWTALLVICISLVPITAITRHPAALAATSAMFLLYGFVLAARVGGADMPVIISFLNSLSGVAASISGIALGNPLTAGVGALVGVAGLILTRIMCSAMNRNLAAVLGGFRPAPPIETQTCQTTDEPTSVGGNGESEQQLSRESAPELMRNATSVIIVPGYGMALAQAQQAVKELMDTLERAGKDVRVAVHPVAGRMPGHMHVLLAEVDVDYEKLCDMAQINPAFAETDLVIAVGACDVMNPAATTAEGTPIYGMPILRVSESRAVIVCNYDDKPGYSGVPNTLYGASHVLTLWGDAAETVPELKRALQSEM